jgi:hypothetical protein
MRSARMTAAACLLACSPLAAQTAPQATPPACTAPEHRQFDFWVGRWDVYPTGKNKLVAHSLIEKLYDGCTIRENWMPLNGSGGGSINMYDPADKRWHQTWQDSQNARVEFDGGMVGGRMVLSGFWKDADGPGKDGLVRMTYSRTNDGAVRQFGEISIDQGLTFKPFFDFTYRRARAAK